MSVNFPDPYDDYPPHDEGETSVSETSETQVQAPAQDGRTSIKFVAGPGVTGCDLSLEVVYAFGGDATTPEYGAALSKGIETAFTGVFSKLAQVAQTAQNFVSGMPKAYVSVHETVAQAPARTGVPVSVANQAGVQAVAAGAPVGGQDGWETYPNRFDPNETYRTKSKTALPIEVIQDFCDAFAIENGLNPKAFVVYDERNEQGRPISATANFKVTDEAAEALGARLVPTNKKVVGRVHVNRDGSLKMAADKHWSTLISTGVLDAGPLSIHGSQAPAPAPAAAPQAQAAPVQAPAPTGFAGF